ncbi:MATN1 [Branchiostoma lanceolatum]|uniref:MATN1 protein n=1 Tax=Branchiostoma lanceolatum TaxID=7740 RepID=A0A8J9ZE69_BRALA|nr:MATN1 [Branchiostoma lanceolatum]
MTLTVFALLALLSTAAAQQGQVCSAKLDLMLVLDGSGSVGDADFAKTLQFAENVVNAFDIGPDATQVGVVQYSDSNSMEFNLGAHADKPSTIAAVNNIVYQGGGTTTGDALTFVNNQANWRGDPVPKVAIVVTDGKSTDDVTAPAQALAAQGVAVYAIGVGNYDLPELQLIANGNNNNVIELTDYNALTAAIDQIAAQVCIDIDECQSQPCQNGGQCINGDNRYDCQCAPGFTGTNCEFRPTTPAPVCDAPLDLFFVLDGSGSVTDANFDKMKQFTKNVVNAFDISPTATQVGVVQYSDSNSLEFNLGDNADKPSTLAAIDNIVYQGGGTSTGSALEFARLNAAWRGGNVPKVMIVVTDGKSGDSVTAAAQNLAGNGVEVYAIGVGNYDSAELLDIAANNQNNVIELTDFNALQAEIEQIAQTVCVVAQTPNPCVSNPCQNGGQCVSINGGQAYQCRCPTGFVGPQCQIVNYCVNHQCQNGAACVNQPGQNGYTCNCLPGWEGPHCETPSCQNTVSLCGNSPGWPDVSLCSESYVLAACPEFCGTCSCPTNPECKNGGSRGNDPNLFGEDTCDCVCVGSWTGPTCEVCSLSCANGGVVDQGTCTCVCRDGWDGPTCSDVCADSSALCGANPGWPTVDSCTVDYVQAACHAFCGVCTPVVVNPPVALGSCQAPVDLVFVVDGSGSVTAPEFEKVKTFMKNVVTQFTIGAADTKVGVIQYSSTVQEEFSLNAHFTKTAVLNAIDNIVYMGGGTLTGSAITYMKDNSQWRPNVAKIAIVVTDGQSSDDVAAPSTAAQNTGITMHAIGVGGNVDQSELAAIASTAQYVNTVANFDALDAQMAQLTASVCEGANDQCELPVLQYQTCVQQALSTCYSQTGAREVNRVRRSADTPITLRRQAEVHAMVSSQGLLAVVAVTVGVVFVAAMTFTFKMKQLTKRKANGSA